VATSTTPIAWPQFRERSSRFALITIAATWIRLPSSTRASRSRPADLIGCAS
jgi:hypothetical protein